MSSGRRAFALLVQPFRQALQQSGATGACSSSGAACHIHGNAWLPAWRSLGEAGSHLRHLATALPTSARKVSLMTNLKQLSKFKLSSLVVLTASAGFVMGSGDKMDWAGLVWTSVGTFGAAACANTLNQIYEVANDRMMKRTMNRPLPSGRMNKFQALAFAIAAGTFGLGTLHYQTNDLTTALGAANIFLYAGVYTPLKQISIGNTWVGAVVGAIPPLMGWASATGQLDAGAFVLAGALFFWQLPHFLALAWLCKDDYLRGGFKMISGLDRSGKRTAAAAVRNAVYLLPLGVLAYWANVTTEPFAWEAAALGGMMLLPAVRFHQQPSQQAARKLFRSSLLYLPLLLAGMAVHRQPYEQHAGLTLGQMQQALWEHLEGPPHAGVLPFMRAAVERSGAAAARVLGFGDAVIRCPSMVHSDDGGNSRRAGAGADGEWEATAEAAGAEDDEDGPGALPAIPAVVVLRHVASMAEHHAVVAEQRQRRRVWVAGATGEQAAGSWREGLDL